MTDKSVDQSVDQLVEIMGEEYAQGFSGRLYYACEKILLGKTSLGKFKMLAKVIIELVPSELRDRIGIEPVTVSGQVVARWRADNAWEDLPDFPEATKLHVVSTIMYCAQKDGNDLIKLWKEDPKRVAWETLNMLKLLTCTQKLAGGWNK